MIGESAEADQSPEDLRENMVEPLEALGEAVSELEGKQKEKAGNALSLLNDSLKTFNGTWTGEGASDLHEKLETILGNLAKSENESDRTDAFSKLKTTTEALRKLGNSGIVFSRRKKLQGVDVCLYFVSRRGLFLQV